MQQCNIKNNAESLVYQAEKTVTDNKDKLSEEVQGNITAGVESLKKALEGEDSEKIKSETDELQKIVFEASSELYKEEGTPEGEAASTEESAEGDAETKDDDTVVEADYEEVKEEK